MKLKALGMLAGAAAMSIASFAANAAELNVPSLVYRTGPYASGGIPLADGFADYFTMINERDGGIGGLKVKVEECETGYKTDRGVECYDRTKEGALVYGPYSTGIAYALIEKMTADKIPLLTMGYGRTTAADGTVFPYVFNFPSTYWNQATAIFNFMGGELGGMDQLKGKRVAYIYLDHPYGKEPIPTLDKLVEKYGFTYDKYPVAPASMTEQKSIWLQIRKTKPDYIVMWGWGAMRETAVKEATNIRYDMSKFIGNWWSAGEEVATPTGERAKGYRAATFNGVGMDYPLYDDMKKYVYDAGKASGDGSKAGTVLYNRAVVNAAYIHETIKLAQEMSGKADISGEDMQKAMEQLDLDAADVKAMGMTGLLPPVKVTCANHEGQNPAVLIQEWTGSEFKIVTDWIPADTAMTRPLIESDAAAYAKEQGITPRSCS
ncbi:ABC transporter substrate-binding protein [Curvivirga aplysinae]|uniref:ABC transporter substrate-binding protein n=1 Tax=Curvivirga aplysinae TaxID=2529852 RepID=UPI0012BD0C72|nr:ABC transporter substrate-binding protein [Curvivirga aplysinae]MTI09504.1 ABC transporter permease [Curvivirga aplysinae]